MSGPDQAKRADETWREYARRQAAPYGLEVECLQGFDRYVEQGETEARAAWCALYDWDLLA